MLNQHLDVIFAISWSLALANIIGTGTCFLFTDQLARIATIRAQLLAPVLLVIMFLGAFMARRHIADIVLFLFFGLLGWTMKRQGWPRPPLIIGFVLGSTVEKYLYISILTYGWTWMSRPWVIVLALLIVAALAAPAIRQYRDRVAAGANP